MCAIGDFEEPWTVVPCYYCFLSRKYGVFSTFDKVEVVLIRSRCVVGAQ